MADETAQRELKEITDFVTEYRAKYGITPSMHEKGPSLSGEAFGEGLITLYQCLIPVVDGHGVWTALNDAAIRQTVLEQVRKDGYVIESRL
ncbi:hypothetical protein HYT55_03950 [Candidatus Woesearchaeota archaeon]|nr:hypothetical protein [Candidatus Woesearchaeota archaeon]